jgi:hypothetical protein
MKRSLHEKANGVHNFTVFACIERREEMFSIAALTSRRERVVVD